MDDKIFIKKYHSDALKKRNILLKNNDKIEEKYINDLIVEEWLRKTH